jgi:hypothetical protein
LLSSQLAIFAFKSFKGLGKLLLLLHLVFLLLLQSTAQALALGGVDFSSAAQRLHVVEPPANHYMQKHRDACGKCTHPCLSALLRPNSHCRVTTLALTDRKSSCSLLKRRDARST